MMTNAIDIFINPEMIKDAAAELVSKGPVPGILSVTSVWGHKPPRACSPLVAFVRRGTHSPTGLGLEGGPGSPGSAPWPGVSGHPGVSIAMDPRVSPVVCSQASGVSWAPRVCCAHGVG